MNRFSRRDCMAMAMASTAAGCASVQSVVGRLSMSDESRETVPSTAPDSLNGLAMANGLRFGSALGNGTSEAPASGGQRADERGDQFRDENLRALLIAQCGIIVPENALKWYALRKTPVGFDFERADETVDFAVRHNMAVRGHTLLWNRAKWMPAWVNSYDFGSKPALAAEKMLRNHIETVCGRYGRRIFCYDVINETISPQTGDFEDSVFTKILGPDVVDICFNAAREAAPHAQLVYNDYMSWGPASETHRRGVLKLLERMRKNNLPVDALGIQAHIGFSRPPDAAANYSMSWEDDWRRFLDEVVAMKLDLAVTEFDVNDRMLPADLDVRDNAVAGLGRIYLDLMLSYPQLRYVMAWGMVDKYSWLQNSAPRQDNEAKRPCPYDDQYRPTPLREAMAASFRSAPLRRAMNYT